MTNDEKRELARARERQELERLATDFEKTVADAQRLSNEIQQWLTRSKKIEAEAKLDKQIEELDYMMKRGKYAHLRVIK